VVRLASARQRSSALDFQARLKPSVVIAKKALP
jgi:hypothetical protein